LSVRIARAHVPRSPALDSLFTLVLSIACVLVMACLVAIGSPQSCLEPLNATSAESDVGIDVETGKAETLSAATQCLRTASPYAPPSAGADRTDGPDASLASLPAASLVVMAPATLVAGERWMAGRADVRELLRPPDALPGRLPA
jgi:hypothetical protein